MLQSDLGRFVTYSSMVHVVLISALFLSHISSQSQRSYTVVDFIGVSSGRRGIETKSSSISVRKPVSPVSEKINLKEDIPIPQVQKKAPILEQEEEREETSPIPSPKLLKKGEETESLSEVPAVGSDSNIGIGFGAQEVTSGGGASNFPYGWYVQSIRRKLDSHWKVLSGNGRRIYTQVAFTILRDGEVQDLDVETSSGNDSLDRTAIRAISDSRPFPPLPVDYPETNLRVHVQFTVK